MVGFGRKCQKLGRKQGLVENKVGVMVVYSGYSRYRHYRRPKLNISRNRMYCQDTPRLNNLQIPQILKSFKSSNYFLLVLE